MRQFTLFGRTFPAIVLVPVAFAVTAESAAWAAWMFPPKRGGGEEETDADGTGMQ